MPGIISLSTSFSLPPLLEKIKTVLPPQQEVYLVGGAVRDLLLNRLSRDFDFAVPANGIALAKRVAGRLRADYMTLDDQRDTGRVILNESGGERIFLDFAAYRGDTLEADLRGRDFTINSLAYDIRSQRIIDPLGGGLDLRAKRIRASSPEAFSEDPVRVLRAARMAASLGFQIEKESRGWLKQAASQIGRVSPERLRDELFKILEGPKADASIRVLDAAGVIGYLLPELSRLKGVEQPRPHVYDVWTHTLAVLRELEKILYILRLDYSTEDTQDLFTGLLAVRLGRYREQFARHFEQSVNADRSLRALLFFAALYHDVSKPDTKTIEESGRIRFFDHDVQGAEVAAERARAFNLSNDEISRLRAIVANHMRIHFHASRLEGEKKMLSRRAIYRFFKDAGEAGVDLVLLAMADLRATRASTLSQETWSAYLDVARVLLENYWERPDETVAPPRLLNGDDLMRELDLPPGPAIGQLLEAIRERQATGKIVSREQAVQYAREWLRSEKKLDRSEK